MSEVLVLKQKAIDMTQYGPGSLITVLFAGNTLVDVGSIGVTDNGTTRVVQNNLTYPTP